MDPVFEAALDAALARALTPPQLPADFRAGLGAALALAAEQERTGVAARARLEREERQRQRDFEAGYLRLRQRTLGTLIGGAFAAGAAVAVAMPWLREVLGTQAPLVLSVVGSGLGLAIGVGAWLNRGTGARLLSRF
jgi:hypothetical protein